MHAPPQEDINRLLSTFHKVMHVKMYTDNEALRNKYYEAATKHNEKIMGEHPDAGFDLFTPYDCSCNVNVVTKINFGVSCSAKMVYDDARASHTTGYYLHPRSSLSKTKLRLANSTGVIDSGYRGNLIGAFDCISKVECDGETDDYLVLKFDKLVQLCAPDLCPIIVEVVNESSKLGGSTLRGSGGFGSSGR